VQHVLKLEVRVHQVRAMTEGTQNSVSSTALVTGLHLINAKSKEIIFTSADSGP
jgi:hypothetical protein